MKLSWGYRVMFLYIGFIALIVFFVTKSLNQKVDLVSTDYYAQELKYQDKIESIKRNNDLTIPAIINYDEFGLSVVFPAELKSSDLKGTIHLFRPSDSNKDKSYPIKTDVNNIQAIPTSELEKGMFRVKIEYEANGKSYYTEKQIVIR